MSQGPKYIYANEKQQLFLSATQPYKMFLGGRGTGKTTSIGFEQYQSMVEMPKSRGFIASATYGVLLNVTLPGVTAVWDMLGLVEGEDYVVCKKPPGNFARCYNEPRKYDNVISFSNGRRVVLFSMDRPDLNRGGSYTDGDVDEAALMPQHHISNVIVPSIRGYVGKYRTHRRGQIRYYTSVPWKPSGYWTLEYETKSTNQPNMYHLTEATSLDNLEALGGQEVINRWEAEMPYHQFLVEVMNVRVKKTELAFYHNFDADKHSYTQAYDSDQFYQPDKILNVSFDFSGYFNCCTVWQDQFDKASGLRYEYCLTQIHVKSSEGKIAELVDKLIKQFANHKNKLINLYGDPRGHDPKPDTPLTMFQQIQQRLKRSGWNSEIKVRNVAVKSHKERREYMNDILAEEDNRLPRMRFNDQTCKDCSIAMQVTNTSADGSKDKSKEKDRDFNQAHAPHYTDTVDYYFTQKHGSAGIKNRPSMSAEVM